GLQLTPIDGDVEQAKFDLELTIHEEADELHAALSYKTELFDRETIARMAVHFERLLSAAIAAPHQRVAALAMLDDAERRQLLVDWNTPQAEESPNCTWQALFEMQVRSTPRRTAVVFDGESLDYATLNDRANRLARRLQHARVGPDTLVALCVARSLEMLVGLIAILKAGGAYVPIDPTHPQERIAQVLDDARPIVVLTQQHLLERLPAIDVPTFLLDGEDSSGPHESVENPGHTATPANLAYVIYTSGSTGKPKGVGVSHASLVNFAAILSRQIYTGDHLQLTQNAPYVFDMSLKHISMLSRGHTLHVLKEEIRLDPEAMLAYFRANRIDGFECTPSQWNLLVESLSASDDVAKCLPAQVLLGGEAIDAQHWKQWKELPGTRMFNMYGPTEATIDCTLCEMTGQPLPTIGQPVSNCQVFLLDPELNPVPIGVAGELYIAGAGLARGYWNRPDATAEKFLVNPHSAAPGARMYRSGDLARYRSDGTIEYMGRADDQVKVRGFRIELGDIEAAITALPTVRQTIVVARERGKGDKRLIAYVVCEDSSVIRDAATLRNLLLRSLPLYMVPAKFVFLDRMPLTVNGKVDRKALPDEGVADDVERRYRAPSNQTERDLAAIWEEVLELEQVGTQDNFFEIGGHSLLATKIIVRARDRIGVNIPILRLFETPTISGLAAYVALSQQIIGDAGFAAGEQETEREDMEL
ncbi:MAG: amino acid adenylation domain-containing protein, partial [Tahibacter sp.]